MKDVKPIYKNDRKAPRLGKGEFSTKIITKELWKEFIKNFPEYKEKTWKEFKDDWEDLAQTIRYETAHNPLGVKLGSYTGELKYQYLPNTFQAKDNKTSEEIGEPVVYLNILTKGKVGKIIWERKKAARFNKMLNFFGFSAHREIDQHVKNVNPDSVRTARIH